MTVPAYQELMLPLLRYLADGEQHSTRNTIESLAKEFALSEEDRKEMLPSGRQRTFDNRVGWARTYLKKAGLLENPRRGVINISSRGRDVLSANPTAIDVQFLRQFDEFVEFQQTRRDKESGPTDESTVSRDTPEETLEAAYQKLKLELADEILSLLQQGSPAFFEKVVVDLIVAMGYGGSRRDAGKAIGQSGDEGIDGIIKEDKLGLDIIYLQAKRWQANVGRPEIQKFAGALQGQRARKGIFITTSSFSRDALDYVTSIDTKIILIDGTTLADLMIEHGVGVNRIALYEVKSIDSDYFVED